MIKNLDSFNDKFGSLFNSHSTGQCSSGVVYYPDFTNVGDYSCLETCPSQFVEEQGMCLPEN